jgi:hypothetical protein
VPYQVIVNSNPANNLATLGSTSRSVADLRGFALAGDHDLLLPHSQSIRATSDSESGLLRPVSLGSPSGIIEAARCSAEDVDPGIINVTIVY